MARRFGRVNVVSKNIFDYNIGIIGESGIGKEQPLSAKIITPEGIKTMGEMKVGSKVIGQDGKPYNVIGVYPQGLKPIYKVEFSDGSVVECGLDHLWKTQSKKQRENGNYSIRMLRDMIDDYDTQKVGYKYSVELPKPVEFNCGVNLRIEPYLLGVMLGDGYLTGSTVEIKNEENCVISKALDMYLKTYSSNFEEARAVYDKYNRLRLSGSPTFKNDVVNYGINVGSRDKFIPKDYLFASIKDRKSLLEGLIDTDGSISKGCSVRFSSYSKQLAKDVRFLAKSLGFAATFKTCFRKDGDVEYYVNIMGDITKLNLSKKHTRKIKERHFNYALTIRNIEYVRHEQAQCIMIDNPQHLYLTNDFIVTHNTTLVKEVCEKTAGKDGYIVFDVGREDGTKAISGIVAETVTTFEHQLDDDGNKLPKYEGTKGVGVMDVVDDIIEYKDEYYKDLKVVVFDTLDELINITENYVVDLANKENRRKGKPADVSTINEAFGGFMRGQDRVIEEILKVKDRLNAIGVQFWFVGHTKMRTKTDPLTQAEYDSFTTNLPQRYFVAFKDKLHFLGVIVMDRQIDKTIEKQFGHSVTKGILSNEKRIINFRDDNYAIDSKSRFADIEPTIEYGADNFIQAIEDAIEKERNADNTVNTEKLEKERKSEEEKEAKKIKEATISKIKNENIDEDELKTKALNEIKVILSNEVNQTENLSTIQKILQENKVGNLVNAELSILNDIISKLVK